MSQEARHTFRGSSSSASSALRKLGRIAIWTVLGLLLVRGFGAVLASPQAPASPTASLAAGADQASEAFAVRFARAYLADPSARALSPFLAEGVRIGAGRPPRGSGQVAQAEVSGSEELGEGRALLTVACELRDARTLYLAVPVVRSKAGEVAALGAPSIVAAPGVAGADPERPQPLAGPDAEAIAALVAKFLPTYLAAAEPSSLSYLLAPGAVVVPLGGEVRFGSLAGVAQLGSGEGARRSVLASVRVADPASGASYPLLYRLELIRAAQGARWYVSSIRGASA